MKTVREMKESIGDGSLDTYFHELYGNDLQTAKERYLLLLERFQQEFPLHDAVAFVSAPGRSEVGGNHTDHQHGRVLAAAIDLDTLAVISPAMDGKIIVSSEGFAEIQVDLEHLEKLEAEKETSVALIKGICQGFLNHNLPIGGFRACITSNVFGGSGLSSSAAFEVLIGNILANLYSEEEVDPILIAQISQWSENEYFGKPCGLMDQMACSLGGFVAIDFHDPQQPIVKKINFSLEAAGYALCIVNTRGSHADLTDAYASIPYEMKQVAQYLGEDYLRDVPYETFRKALPTLRKLFGDRAVLRSYHFFQEDQRAALEADALMAHNLDGFFALVKESGRSSFEYLQNVFVPEQGSIQPLSIALALADDILQGNGAARVHGGGFAGTIQCFVPFDLVETFCATMDEIFGEGSAHSLRIRNHGGICMQ